MLDLRRLKNAELNARVIEIAKREKELLAEAILHIAEVQRRQMYFGYETGSMFEYLTVRAGFPNGSAYRL